MFIIIINDFEVVFLGSVKDDIIVEELKNGIEIIVFKNVFNLEIMVIGIVVFVGKGVFNFLVVLEFIKKNIFKIVF